MFGLARRAALGVAAGGILGAIRPLRAETANGRVRLAPVILRELRIGQLSRRGMPAVVNEAPMTISLLGMSFLRSLQSWEVRGDRLLLEW